MKHKSRCHYIPLPRILIYDKRRWFLWSYSDENGLKLNWTMTTKILQNRSYFCFRFCIFARELCLYSKYQRVILTLSSSANNASAGTSQWCLSIMGKTSMYTLFNHRQLLVSRECSSLCKHHRQLFVSPIRLCSLCGCLFLLMMIRKRLTTKVVFLKYRLRHDKIVCRLFGIYLQATSGQISRTVIYIQDKQGHYVNLISRNVANFSPWLSAGVNDFSVKYSLLKTHKRL